MKRAMERSIATSPRAHGPANSRCSTVRVRLYGTPTPLNQVASLNVADARSSRSSRGEEHDPVIDKAIRRATSASTRRRSELVRLPIPPLTQERRKELVKQIKKMTEDARVAVRGARREANELLKEAEKDRRAEGMRKLGTEESGLTDSHRPGDESRKKEKDPGV